MVATLSLWQIIDLGHETGSNASRILGGVLLLRREVGLALVLKVVLVLFNLFQLRVHLHLQSLILAFEVFALVNQVRHLLVPLGAFPLMVQQKFGLLAFCLTGLLLHFPLPCVEGLPFFLQLAAHLCNLAIPLGLDQVVLLL